MRKLPITVFILAALCCLACLFAACAKKADYSDFISEKRTNVYIYQDDGINIKIYCSQKEQPYAADGIKGDVSPLCEAFVSLPKTYETVLISFCGNEGEMNYQAVYRHFYLSFSAEDFKSDEISVTLTFGGESKTYTALSVKHSGVMSCEEAVKCVTEHDKELFASLSEGGVFRGEIFVRLLYDEGCYYYVGVCDQEKHITAYLLDGERGIIIATKHLQG